MPFNSDELLKRLRALPRANRYIVGFSGGADSSALLAALDSCRGDLEAKVEAVHFNHGLQPDSRVWDRHCREFCELRGIDLTTRDLDLSGDKANLESRARTLRYRFLEEFVDEQTLYLTGHNLDDRAETFLLHALRGSGLEGLGSIPVIRPLGRGKVARPLLDFPRNALEDYLKRNEVAWIEDPSNQDISLDRNFIRHEILPLLESRWPAARNTLARAATHLRSAGETLRALVAEHAGLDSYEGTCIPLEAIDRLGPDTAGLVLRTWLLAKGVPSPPEARLVELLNQLGASSSESHCAMEWADWSLRKYADELRLERCDACPPCPLTRWNSGPELHLGPESGLLRIEGNGITIPDCWVVGPRRPGQRMRLSSAGPARKLKKLFQELPIPPWQRLSIPVLYWDEEAIAIGDWLRTHEFRQWLSQNELEYHWEPGTPELRETQEKCREVCGTETPA
jgi:tRNA(Ile)-lysidine synthase